MTDPTVLHRFENNAAVAGSPAVADRVEPHLAAIQRSYEEAKSNIVDPAPSWPSAADEGEAFPGTEKIDVRTIGLPAVPDGSSGTEAMSVAARRLAEQLAAEDEEPPVRRTGQAPASAEPRGWWRSIRSALHGPQS